MPYTKHEAKLLAELQQHKTVTIRYCQGGTGALGGKIKPYGRWERKAADTLVLCRQARIISQTPWTKEYDGNTESGIDYVVEKA
jgi:hypothetical protein